MATRGTSSPTKRSSQISRIGGGGAQHNMLFVEESKVGSTLSCTSLLIVRQSVPNIQRKPSLLSSYESKGCSSVGQCVTSTARPRTRLRPLAGNDRAHPS